MGIRKKNRKRRTLAEVGLSPGTVRAPENELRNSATRLSTFCYNEAQCLEQSFNSVAELKTYLENRKEGCVLWLNVDGLGNSQMIEEIGKLFNLHPLTLEDITHLEQRPKKEDLEHYLYVVVTMLFYSSGSERERVSEQVSIVMGHNAVISFQEQEHTGDVFEVVRNRLRSGKGRMRKLGPDYLCYALLDAIVDYYYVILEDLGERIDGLEQELIGNPTQQTLHVIYALKRELLYVRRLVWPLREVISGLQRDESGMISSSTTIFLRDLYDHVVQVMDSVETFREMLANMLEIYLSSVSHRMNAIMKVLTVITTIFMPLTFIAGVYGMNFKHMPELEMTYGYPLVLLSMLVIVGIMLAYFKKKHWLEF